MGYLRRGNARFLHKWGICKEKTRDFRFNGGCSKRKRDFRLNGGFAKRKRMIFSSRILHLKKNHAFSLFKSPTLGNIMRFLFANPPFKRKSRLFSLRIPNDAKITRFLFENPPFMRETRSFSSRNPIEPENHAFSLQKYHI